MHMLSHYRLLPPLGILYWSMVATIHAFVGAAIATKVSNPFISVPLAFLSHFVLNLIPHWDQGINWRHKSHKRLFLESLFDVLFGFGLVGLLFRSKVDLSYLYTVVFAAQLPDWLEAPYLFFGWRGTPWKYFYKFQSNLQWRSSSLVGISTQLATIMLALWWSL